MTTGSGNAGGEHPNLLPPLAEEPKDLRVARDELEKVTEVVYRLGLRALPVPGLPQAMEIDAVRVDFVYGPLRVQRTDLRQRHGLPVVFDKAMVRTEVGAGEFLAVFTVSVSPVPDDFERTFLRWRAKASAAAGMLAAILDERVAGEEVFEDAIFLADGNYVGAADMRGGVRTFLPFEVNASDRVALDQLSQMSLSESSRAARAARLYRRAATEGPTADAYAMLWVAAECFSTERSPSRQHLERVLREAGLNPDGLPISVGRLIGLRGEIQHQGLEADSRLETAYYEMEAVVRALIRRDAGIRGGWWPAADNPAGFADPFKPMVDGHRGMGASVWHSALPDIAEPEPIRIPRQVPRPDLDPRLQISPDFGDQTALVASIVIDAIEWHAPDMTLEVALGRPETAPPEAAGGSNAHRIWLDSGLLEGVDDAKKPEVIIKLTWRIHGLVGTAVAQRFGLTSDGGGTGFVLVEAIGSYLAYQRLVTYGPCPPPLLSPGPHESPEALGAIAGFAAAGDPLASEAAEALEGESRELVSGLIEIFEANEIGPGAAIDLMEEFRRTAASGSDAPSVLRG